MSTDWAILRIPLSFLIKRWFEFIKGIPQVFKYEILIGAQFEK